MKLDKAIKTEHAEIVKRLEAAQAEIEEAEADLNAAREELLAKFEAYNSAAADARSWCESAAQEIDDHLSDKSERWQESEKGQALAAWRDELGGIGISDINETDVPEPNIDMDFADFEALSLECDLAIA